MDGRHRLRIAPESHDRDSPLRLRIDILSARLLLWIANTSRSGTPSADSHLYLADRYVRLARIYTSQGWPAKAAASRLKAERHLYEAGPPDPRPAAAVAMSRPEPTVMTDARAGLFEDEDDPERAS